MLTLFPDLLNFSFLGIALLRITAGIAFLYASYSIAMNRAEISRAQVPLVKHAPQWLVLASALIILVVAILLGVGLYTQAAAIAGMLIALKYFVLARRYPHLIPFSRGTSALLIMICLFLLVSGAGPFAFDLPL